MCGSAPWTRLARHLDREGVARGEDGAVASSPPGPRRPEPPTCRPKTASTFGSSSAPSFTMSGAPPSSPVGRALLGGLEEEDDGAGQPRLAGPRAPRRRPAASRCGASWPQACMTPGSSGCGRATSFFSSMGSASMSARRATTPAGPAAAQDADDAGAAPPGSAPRGRGRAAAPPRGWPVRSSRLLSSGWACRSRRAATTAGASALGRGADLGVGGGRRRRRRRAGAPGRSSIESLLGCRAAMIRAVAAAPPRQRRPGRGLACWSPPRSGCRCGSHGDAGEYLLMLESWHGHGSPELRPAGPRRRCARSCARTASRPRREPRPAELPRGARRAALLLPLLGLLARGTAGARRAARRSARLAAAGAAADERRLVRPRARRRSAFLPWSALAARSALGEPAASSRLPSPS